MPWEGTFSRCGYLFSRSVGTPFGRGRVPSLVLRGIHPWSRSGTLRGLWWCFFFGPAYWRCVLAVAQVRVGDSSFAVFCRFVIPPAIAKLLEFTLLTMT